jgi:colicin import membrane protein
MKRLLSMVCVVASLVATAAGAQVQQERPLGASVPAEQEAPTRAAGREAVRKERESIARTLRQAEAGCYQRFAVEDCLRDARRRARDAQAMLRQREAVWDEAERQERSARRQQDIQQRQNERAVPAPVRPAASRDSVAPEAGQAKAAQRADHLVQKQEDARKAQAQHRQAVQQQAAQARARHIERVQAAAVRKARIQQRQAEDAAKGKKPAAPLPP